MAAVSCPNYLFCGNETPNESIEKMCVDCEIIFGRWSGGRGKADIKDNIECPICLQTKMGITQPKCEHYVCLDCFRRCQYGDQSYDIGNKPAFPYDKRIEKMYFDSLENPNLEIEEIEELKKTWESEYNLLKMYNKKYNEWEDKQFEHALNEENLMTCSVCRQ